MSNARFSILQAKAVKDKQVSDSQFRTLAALGMYADKDGWCYPSLKTLGLDLGKSKQAVGRDTIALRKLGYLEVTARYTKEGSRRSCMYRLKFDLPRQHDVDTPSTPDVDTPSTPDVDVNDPLNEPIYQEKQKKGDLVDGVLFFTGKAKERGEDKVEGILQELERGLRVNICRSVKNQTVARRILKDARPVARFLQWVNADEWRAAHAYLYADMEKVWRDYPQAFPAEQIQTEGKSSFYA